MSKKITTKPANRLNISLIKYYGEQKNISLRAMARVLDMTATGFNLSINKGTIRATTLDQLLQILDIPYENLLAENDPNAQGSEADTNYNLDLEALLTERAEIQSYPIHLNARLKKCG